MPDDGYPHVPMLDTDGESGGPGVYVADLDWFDRICAKNARLFRQDAELAAARSTEDGDPA